MNAVGYCRVSTASQRDEGVSLDVQKERIAAWAGAHDLKLEATFVDVMSGGFASNRPGLQSAVALACKTRATLVVYSLSRLARSVRDTIAIAERIDRHGANLASLTERIDTNSAVGKMVFRLLSTLSEFERDQIAERTQSAMSHLRRANRRISPIIPFGYSLSAGGQSLVTVEKEANAIAYMQGRRKRGLSFERIAAELEALGVPTRSGRPWQGSSVRGILERVRRLDGFPNAA